MKYVRLLFVFIMLSFLYASENGSSIEKIRAVHISSIFTSNTEKMKLFYKYGSPDLSKYYIYNYKDRTLSFYTDQHELLINVDFNDYKFQRARIHEWSPDSKQILISNGPNLFTLDMSGLLSQITTYDDNIIW